MADNDTPQFYGRMSNPEVRKEIMRLAQTLHKETAAQLEREGEILKPSDIVPVFIMAAVYGAVMFKDAEPHLGTCAARQLLMSLLANGVSVD